MRCTSHARCRVADHAGQDLGVADVEVDAAAVVVVLPGAGEVGEQDPGPGSRRRRRASGRLGGAGLGRRSVLPPGPDEQAAWVATTARVPPNRERRRTAGGSSEAGRRSSRCPSRRAAAGSGQAVSSHQDGERAQADAQSGHEAGHVGDDGAERRRRPWSHRLGGRCSGRRWRCRPVRRGTASSSSEVIGGTVNEPPTPTGTISAATTHSGGSAGATASPSRPSGHEDLARR